MRCFIKTCIFPVKRLKVGNRLKSAQMSTHPPNARKSKKVTVHLDHTLVSIQLWFSSNVRFSNCAVNMQQAINQMFVSNVVLSLLCCCIAFCVAYDPTDKELATILPAPGTFEPFYPREQAGVPNGVSRPPHGHGSFYAHRHPSLVEVKNSAAYGYRFDGKRRFNFD